MALVLAVGMSACGGGDDPDDDPPVREGMSRGANVTAYSADALAQSEAVEALRALKADGADHVTFPVLWFMAGKTSNDIQPDQFETPSDVSLLAAMSAARALGLGVGVAPHLNVRDGTFRGEIEPADRVAWHAAHRRMVEHYAELARQGGADLLVVGSELQSMSRDEQAWRDTIAAARARYPGQLTYAANWVQEAEQVRFWDALDLVGVDAYMPLTPKDPTPTLAELDEAWEPWVTRLERLGERTGKPVRLTELGYTSREGTAAAPAVEGDGPVDQDAQAQAYEAAFRALGHREWLAGIDIWDWSADGRVEPGNYSPQGKRAESVLARWYGAPGRPTASGR